MDTRDLIYHFISPETGSKLSDSLRKLMNNSIYKNKISIQAYEYNGNYYKIFPTLKYGISKIHLLSIGNENINDFIKNRKVVEIDEYNTEYEVYINGYTLCIQYEDMIIGYVNSNDRYAPHIGKHLYISLVIVHPLYRGIGLCKLLILKLIEFTGKSIYSLKNIGDIPACKCYVNAFSEKGFIDNICMTCDGINCEINRNMVFTKV